MYVLCVACVCVCLFIPGHCCTFHHHIVPSKGGAKHCSNLELRQCFAKKDDRCSVPSQGLWVSWVGAGSRRSAGDSMIIISSQNMAGNTVPCAKLKVMWNFLERTERIVCSQFSVSEDIKS